MTATGSDRLVIVDNCLVDSRGHHLNLSTTLSLRALETGAEVIWYAHHSLPDDFAPPGVTVRRCFSQSTYQLLAAGRDDVDLSAAYVEALREISGSSHGGQTRVLFHTADGHVFRAVAQLARSAAKQLPGFAIHVSTPYETRLMPGGAKAVDSVFAELARSPWLNHGLYLWAETVRLAAIFRDTYGAAVEPLALPAPHWTTDTPAPPASDGRLHVVYLGAAREDKGFCRLSELAAAAVADPLLANNLRLTIQASPPQRGYRPALTNEIEALRQIPNVALILRHLAADDYHSLIRSADVVLMLYDVSKYFARGSGIAFEALSAGKFLLATTGMFLEELPAQDAIAYGTDVRQWLDALRAWGRDVPGLRQTGVRLGTQFRSAHTATVYLGRLAERDSNN